MNYYTAVSPFRFVAVLVFFLLQCRRYGLSPFWCRRFGVSPFWFVAVLTIDQTTSKIYSHPPTQLLKNPLIHCYFIVFIALILSTCTVESSYTSY